ncbi:hypothetical protein ABIB50_005425 [Mucilaginibacter sp. UYCu711]
MFCMRLPFLNIKGSFWRRLTLYILHAVAVFKCKMIFLA